LRGGSACTILSSRRGELGHAVNENPQPWCGVVGDSRLNVKVDDAELDCELPGDPQSSLGERWVSLPRLGNPAVRKPTPYPNQASSDSSGKALSVPSDARGEEASDEKHRPPPPRRVPRVRAWQVAFVPGGCCPSRAPNRPSGYFESSSLIDSVYGEAGGRRFGGGQNERSDLGPPRASPFVRDKCSEGA